MENVVGSESNISMFDLRNLHESITRLFTLVTVIVLTLLVMAYCHYKALFKEVTMHCARSGLFHRDTHFNHLDLARYLDTGKPQAVVIPNNDRGETVLEIVQNARDQLNLGQ